MQSSKKKREKKGKFDHVRGAMVKTESSTHIHFTEIQIPAPPLIGYRI